MAQFPIINVNLTDTAATQQLTLPLASLTPGLRIRVAIKDAKNQQLDVKVTGAVANNFAGVIALAAGNTAVVTAGTRVSFANNNLTGDYMDFYSTGSRYLFFGTAQAAAAMTTG